MRYTAHLSVARSSCDQRQVTSRHQLCQSAAIITLVALCIVYNADTPPVLLGMVVTRTFGICAQNTRPRVYYGSKFVASFLFVIAFFLTLITRLSNSPRATCSKMLTDTQVDVDSAGIGSKTSMEREEHTICCHRIWGGGYAMWNHRLQLCIFATVSIFLNSVRITDTSPA